MSWNGRFNQAVTPSPSSSPSVDRDTPTSSRNSLTPPFSSTSAQGPKSLKHTASLSNLKLEKMVITSPQPSDKSSMVPKAREAEFPLNRPVKAQPLHDMDDRNVKLLREMFPGIPSRTCMSTLDLADHDMNTAAEYISAQYPRGFGVFASPSPSPPVAEASFGIKKEIPDPSARPAMGPKIKLAYNRNQSPVKVKSEERSSSPEDSQADNAVESVSTRSSSSYEDSSDVDMDSEVEQEGSDGAPEDAVDEDEDMVDDPENTAEESEESADAKAEELHTIFPRADLEECKRILQCVDNNLEEAFDMLEEERPSDFFDDTVLGDDSIGSSSSVGASSSHLDSSKSPSIKSSNFKTAANVNKKRAIEDPEERLCKRSKVLNGDTDVNGKLLPAGNWVADFFSESSDISFTFKNGEHPCQFPKKLLTKHFKKLEKFLASKSPTADDRYILNDHTQESFDLLLQWAVAKNVQLDPRKHKDSATKITSILAMLHLGHHLQMSELSSLNHSTAHLLTTILTSDRRAMQGHHIRFAFQHFAPGNPIQSVFAKAAVRARLEYQYTGEPREQGMGRPSERIDRYENEAKRAAYRGHVAPYAEEVADIPDFELLVLRLQNSTWENRERAEEKIDGPPGRTGKPRQKTLQGYYLTDPLSRKRFFL